MSVRSGKMPNLLTLMGSSEMGISNLGLSREYNLKCVPHLAMMSHDNFVTFSNKD